MDDKRVARVSEIIASSSVGFEDAVRNGFQRATKTLRGFTGLKILEQRVAVSENQITEYRVRLEVVFVLEGPCVGLVRLLHSFVQGLAEGAGSRSRPEEPAPAAGR